MGSWNGTCAITQLPIVIGDPVAVFLLVGDNRPHEPAAHCYPTEFYGPRSIQLYGEYSDYGGFDVEDGWNKEFVIRKLQEQWREVKQDSD